MRIIQLIVLLPILISSCSLEQRIQKSAKKIHGVYNIDNSTPPKFIPLSGYSKTELRYYKLARKYYHKKMPIYYQYEYESAFVGSRAFAMPYPPSLSYLPSPSNPPLGIQNVEQLTLVNIAEAIDSIKLDRSFYAFGEGYAIVTGMQQFDDDGNIINNLTKVNSSSPLHFIDYIELLFTSAESRFRFFVFLMGNYEINYSNKTRTSKETARSLLVDGASFVEKFEETDITPIRVLVYEFVSKGHGHPLEFITPGSFSTIEHYIKSGIPNYYP